MAQSLRDEGAKLFEGEQYAAALCKFLGALSSLNKEPDNAALRLSCLLNASSCSVKLGKFEDAEQYATDAISTDKKSFKAYFRRGQARRALGRFSQARFDFMMAREIVSSQEQADAIDAELLLLKEQEGKNPQKQQSTGNQFSNFVPSSSHHVEEDDDDNYGAYANDDEINRLQQQLAALQQLQGGQINKNAFTAPAAPTNKHVVLPTEYDGVKKSADEGDSAACIKLATAYDDRGGANQAFTYYEKAAELGNPRGQSLLAWCYRTGFGVPQSSTTATKWYLKAAEAGDMKGQACLGFCYEKGDGIAADPAQAARWYKAAAEQGDAVSQVNYGLALETGRGVPQDGAAALAWFKKSAAQGNNNARVNVGLAYEKGTCGASKNMNEAFKWYFEAAKSGDHTAQAIVGCCFEKGQGTSVNKNEAMQWYAMSAKQGNEHAKRGLQRLVKGEE